MKWKSRTIKTLISRLVKKGAVKITEEGYRYRYTAAVEESACIRSETTSFVRRVYQGAMKPALAAFIEDADLSEKEIDDIQKILHQKRKTCYRESRENEVRKPRMKILESRI